MRCFFTHLMRHILLHVDTHAFFVGVTIFRPKLTCTHDNNHSNLAFDSSFIDFQVWDFPGQMDFFDPTFDTTAIFGEVGALVFVIDSQVLLVVTAWI